MKFRAQYAASNETSRASGSTVDTSRTAGACAVIPSSALSSSGPQCATSGLWAAASTRSSRQLMPRASRAAAVSFTAVVSPATISDSGPLTATTVTGSPMSASASRTWSRLPRTAYIRPVPAVSPSRRARRTMTLTASGRLSAPAVWAAATSPRLCPTMAPGTTPRSRSHLASATCTEKIAGCTISVCASRDDSVGRRISSSSDHEASAAINSAHSSRVSRTSGSEPYRSAAMPAHWPPWPEKTNTGGGTASGSSTTPV